VSLTATPALVQAPVSANTSISGDETKKHAPPLSPSTENSHHSHHSHSSHLTEKARRKQLERNKRKASRTSNGNDPMVWQLLVKMAREINPF